jgi:AP2 domain
MVSPIRHTPDQICIFRMYHPLVKSYYQTVMIRRNGKSYTKRFYESRCGGEKATLKMAQAWRDTIIATHPPMSMAQFCSIVRSNNSSGVAGVYLKRNANHKNALGEAEPYAWVARIPLGTGKIRLQSFLVKTYGNTGAKKRAIAMRKQALADLGTTVFKQDRQPIPVSSTKDVEQLHAMLRLPEERRMQRVAKRIAREQHVAQYAAKKLMAAQMAAQQALQKATSSGEPYISRYIGTAERGGFRVSIVRHGRSHRKSFADGAYGDATAALEAAKIWRDQIFFALPAISKAQAVTRIPAANTSGVAGVYLRREHVDGRYSASWVASAPKQAGKRSRTKGFSIAKYGEKQAFALAVDARRAFVAELDNVPHLPKHAARQMLFAEQMAAPGSVIADQDSDVR